MSDKNISTRRKVFPTKTRDEEGYNSEKILTLKKKRKAHIATVSKLINNITDLIDKKSDVNVINNFSESLEEQIQNIRCLTSQIIKILND